METVCATAAYIFLIAAEWSMMATNFDIENKLASGMQSIEASVATLSPAKCLSM